MPASVSSCAIDMLLATTSSGVRAALAQAMAQIMSVKPGPSVPDADGDLAGDADEGVGGMGHRAFVAAAVGGDAGGGKRVDHGVVAGTANSAATPSSLHARANTCAPVIGNSNVTGGAAVAAANSAGTRIGATVRWPRRRVLAALLAGCCCGKARRDRCRRCRTRAGDGSAQERAAALIWLASGVAHAREDTRKR